LITLVLGIDLEEKCPDKLLSTFTIYTYTISALSTAAGREQPYWLFSPPLPLLRED